MHIIIKQIAFWISTSVASDGVGGMGIGNVGRIVVGDVVGYIVAVGDNVVGVSVDVS